MVRTCSMIDRNTGQRMDRLMVKIGCIRSASLCIGRSGLVMFELL